MQTESERLENDIPCQQKPKKSGHSHLNIRQIDFNTKTVKGDKEGQYIMIKGSIQQEDVTILNVYSPNYRVPGYLKGLLRDLKGDIDLNKIVTGELNTRLSAMHRSDRKSLRKQQS